MVELFEHQKKAVSQLRTGSILNGDVGTGKSLTALAYYISKICGGSVTGQIKMPGCISPAEERSPWVGCPR